MHITLSGRILKYDIFFLMIKGKFLYLGNPKWHSFTRPEGLDILW